MPRDSAAPVDKARASHTMCRVGVNEEGVEVVMELAL